MTESPGARLRALFNNGETTLAPFGALPIHAQMAERAGYEMFELSGATAAWWLFGVADVGWVTLTEVVDLARRITRAVDIPVYADADTGYGGPVNVQRTVSEFIDAGVAGIHIEDQQNPKKAGGQPGIEIISDAEAIGRLNAACAARDRIDPDFVIVARTDGYGTSGGGVEEAIRRGQLYKQETGVDVIFYEGFHTWEQVRTAIAATPGPAYSIPSLDMKQRPPLKELSEMGQALEILPFVLPGVHDAWRILLDVKKQDSYAPMDEYFGRMAAAVGTPYGVHWGDVFGKPSYQEVRELEERFLPADQHRDYVNNINAQWSDDDQEKE